MAIFVCASICLLVLAVHSAGGFNADHRSYSQMTANSDAEADSYFGFSIAHHRFPEGLGLVVGAPFDTASSSIKTGAVYRCPLENSGVCTRVENLERMEDQYMRTAGTVVDLGGNSAFLPTGKNFTHSNLTVNGQLLGYSVFESNGLIGTCAPKFIYGTTNNSRAIIPTGIGRCVVLEDSYTPSTLPGYQWRRDEEGQPDGDNMYFAGVDALIAQEENNLFVVGEALGGFDLASPQDPSGRLMAQLAISNHTPIYSTDASDDSVDSYLGYKMVLGNFLSVTEKHVAASSPRRSRHKGNIAFFSVRNPSTPIPRQADAELRGTQMDHDGYYGYDFAPIKVTKNKFDSLVVGCPLCSRERGKVYFHRNQDGNFQQGVEVTSPLAEGDPGRFGMTVSNIGDIDQDGYEDVAIGAPFANGGSGVVYIYRGTDGGLFPSPSQTLTPPTGLSGYFGYAITGGFHLDNNGYPDFAVSSLSMSSVSPVLLYRSNVKVDVEYTITGFPRQLDLVNLNCDLPDGTKRVCFNITVCFDMKRVNEGDTVENFKINYKVAIDDNFSGGSPRVQVDPLSSSDTNVYNLDIGLERGTRHCEDSLFYMKSDVTEFAEDMLVEMSIQDSSQPLTHLGLHPVLNVSAVNTPQLTFNRNINLTVNCGPNNLCEPAYKLYIGEPNDIVYLNNEQNITFTVSVYNEAEESGLAPQVIITHENGVGRKGEMSISPGALAISNCESGLNREVSCQLKSPIQSAEWVNFTISFHPRANELPLNTSSLKFTFEVSGSQGNTHISTDVSVPIRARASYSLEIISSGGNPLTAFDVYNYETAQNSNCSTPLNQSLLLARIGPVANMRYLVQNSQPTDQGSVIPMSRLTVFWPARIKAKVVNETEACRLLLVPNGIIQGGRIQCQYYGFQLFKDDPRFSDFYNLNSGTGLPVTQEELAKYCSEGVECDIIQCTIQSLVPSSSNSITIQARLWSYSITQNLNVTLWAKVESLTPELKTSLEQKVSINVNAAVQEFVVQCANEYIPIIAVFIGFAVFFIILVLLAFFGFFGQTTIKRKMKEIQEKKEAQSVPEEVNQHEYDETILRDRMETPPEVDDDSITKPKVLSPTSMEGSVTFGTLMISGQHSPSWQDSQQPVIYLARTSSSSPTREETAL